MVRGVEGFRVWGFGGFEFAGTGSGVGFDVWGLPFGVWALGLLGSWACGTLESLVLDLGGVGSTSLS